MPSELDFVTDNNPAIFSYLLDKQLIPDYVMKSARVTEDELEPLNNVAFADPYKRLYPCHTKEACWQSAAYCAGTNNQDQAVKGTIEKMAAAHGISEDVNAVFNEFESTLQKAASKTEEAPMQKYAMTVDFEGFQGRGVENFYPVNTVAQIINAAEDATRDYESGRMPMPVMRKVACAIMEAAYEHELPVSELTGTVRRLGSQNLPDPFACSTLVTMRKDAGVSVEAYQKHISALIDAMEKVASAEEAIKLADETAAELVSLDLSNGIRYSNRMLSPYDIMFTGPSLGDLHKAAAQIVRIENVPVPVMDFLNLSDSVISQQFSKQAAALIRAAKEDVMGDCTEEKCASAHDKLLTLDTDVRKILLATLAGTAWGA